MALLKEKSDMKEEEGILLFVEGSYMGAEFR